VFTCLAIEFSILARAPSQVKVPGFDQGKMDSYLLDSFLQLHLQK
jgi:hypothetical protein